MAARLPFANTGEITDLEIVRVLAVGGAIEFRGPRIDAARGLEEIVGERLQGEVAFGRFGFELRPARSCLRLMSRLPFANPDHVAEPRIGGIAGEGLLVDLSRIGLNSAGERKQAIGKLLQHLVASRQFAVDRRPSLFGFLVLAGLPLADARHITNAKFVGLEGVGLLVEFPDVGRDRAGGFEQEISQRHQ